MPASQKQIDYIEILCNDVGFDTQIKRNDFISNLLGYKVTFLDELAIPEASQVIEKLLNIKTYKQLTPGLQTDPEDYSILK